MVPRETTAFITLITVGVLIAGIATVIDRRSETDGAQVPAVTTTLPPGTSTTTPAETTTTADTAPTTSAADPTEPTTEPTTITAPTTQPTTPATTATTAARSFRRCGSDDIVVTAGTNKRTYVLGEAVRANVVVRMVSSVPCFLPNEAVAWRDASGAIVCCLALPEGCTTSCPPNFNPGEVRTLTPCWDQRTINGAPVGPGRYFVSHRGVQTGFDIVAPDPEAPGPPTC